MEDRGADEPTSRRGDVWTYGRRSGFASSIRRFVDSSICLFLVLLGLALSACDGAGPGDFEMDYVLEAYLIAGERLQPVRLSRTAPVNQRYDFTALAVRGASVRLSLLAADGSVETTYSIPDAPDEPGVYRVHDPGVRVLPLRTYRLEITLPGTGERISAVTVVPDTFSVVAANAREVVFQSTAQLELTLTRSTSPGRQQSYYTFVTEALDAREEQLTPLAKAFFENQEGEVTLEDLRVSGSPVLNEANYDPNPDGTITIKYPWLAVAFFGPNRLFVNALDDNLYDYLRSQSVQQGGSTFSPGEIPNPIEHVEGARGVFGSYARVSYELVVLRPDGSDCVVIGEQLVCGAAAR